MEKFREYSIEAFLALSNESAEKVECIYHLAMVLDSYNCPKLTPREFDFLYDKNLKELRRITNYISLTVDDIEGE